MVSDLPRGAGFIEDNRLSIGERNVETVYTEIGAIE